METLVIAFVIALIIGSVGAWFLVTNRRRADEREERKWAKVSQELEAKELRKGRGRG